MTDAREMILTREPNRADEPLNAERSRKLSSRAERGTSRWGLWHANNTAFGPSACVRSFGRLRDLRMAWR